MCLLTAQLTQGLAPVGWRLGPQTVQNKSKTVFFLQSNLLTSLV